MKKHLLKLVASFTFDPIVPYLKSTLESLDISPEIYNHDYGQVFQELLGRQSQRLEHSISYYAIRFEDFIRDLEHVQEQESVLVETFDKLLAIWSQKDFRRPIFMLILPSSLHLSHPLRTKIAKFNQKWLTFLTELEDQNIVAIDCRTLGEEHCLENVLDPKRNQIGHIPYTEELYMALAVKMVKASFAIFYKPFKVLVVDADNTLWDGVCGELGSKGVKVDEPYRTFQKFLKQSAKRGYLLAIISKNVESDLLAVFDQCNGMLLVPEDFTVIKANWNRKSENMHEIASELGLGLDSFCFFDDNMTECLEVSKAIPQVLTLQVPNRDRIGDFVSQLWFLNRFEVTQEDLIRSSHYKSELKRKKIFGQFDTLDFLKELNINIGIFQLKDEDFARASQLTKRTNQFNATTVRREVGEIMNLQPKSDILWGVEVADKFGYYGFTGIIIGTISGKRLVISDFLLSCRVLGKRIELSIFDTLIAECKLNQLDILSINFIPSERNEPIRNFLNHQTGQYNRLNERYDFIIADYVPNSFLPRLHQGKIQKRSITNTPPIFRFHHVGVAVDIIEDFTPFYLDNGYSGSGIVEDLHQNVYLMMLKKVNNLSIELVAPVDEKSPVVDILSKNGSIPYHICFHVEDINEAIKYLDSKKIYYDIVKPSHWAVLFNANVIFIYIKGVGLIEFVEMPLGSHETIQSDNQIFLLSNQKSSARFFFEAIGYSHAQNGSDSEGKMIFKNKYSPAIIIEKISEDNESMATDFSTKSSPMVYTFTLGLLRHSTDSKEKLRYLRKPYSLEVGCVSQYQQQVRWSFTASGFEYSKLAHRPLYELLATDTLESLRSYFGIQSESFELNQIVPNNIEKHLTLIWENVLKQQNLKINDNFFDLGGHSLLATQIIARIYKDLKVDVKLSDFFDGPTIAEMVEIIHKSEKSAGVIEQRIQPIWNKEECYELSYAQKQMWVLNQLQDNSSFNNMIRAYHLIGELDVTAFEESFNFLIQRHQILRTVFIYKEDRPMQRVLSKEEYCFALEFVDLRTDPKAWDTVLSVQAETAEYNFDIENGPLLKMKLLTIGVNEFVFLLTIHHLITDGWSMGVFFDDLTTFYSELINKTQNNLSPLGFHYKDFAAYSNSEISRQKMYWNNLLKDAALPFVEVPTDFARPKEKTFNGDAVTFDIDSDSIDQLNEICKSQQISTYILLMAIYKLLLYKWTGMTDLIIGTPAAGRHMHELENQIGPYINTLVIRTSFKETNSFNELLRNVRGTVLGANDNQLYPFELLLEDLQLERSVDRSPLFETGFTWQSHQELDGTINNLDIVQIEQQDVFSQHDIWLLGAAHPTKKEYNFTLIYNTDLYTAKTASKFADDYSKLTARILQNGEKNLLDLVKDLTADKTFIARTDIMISEDF